MKKSKKRAKRLTKTKLPDRAVKYRADELETFFWWMRERHNIYLKRKNKEPYPWTDNEVLQEYKFTNVFRQLDRVTEAWTDRYVRLLGRGKGMKDGDLLFHCLMFRIFNWPETYDCLYFGMYKTSKDWNLKQAIQLLEYRRDKEHEKIFTGAYIVSNGASDDRKINVICEALDEAYKMRGELAHDIIKDPTMQNAVEVLQRVPTVGRFVAYEVACDLRHTRLLCDARDRLCWANPGPGAMRGIHRLYTGVPHRIEGTKVDYVAVMRDLFERAKKQKRLMKVLSQCEWPFEMREIEHSLCEFDKFQRATNGEGRPRSKFHPPKDDQLNLPWE